MALKGDLGSIDLANVFQMLMLSEKRGTLEIDADGTRTRLYMDGDWLLVPFHKDSFPDRVLRHLVRLGRVSEENVRKARFNTKTLKKDVLETLVEMHILERNEVDDAYREQMEELVYDLFSYGGEATFEFLEGERPDNENMLLEERYRLSVSGLVMEAARRVDEWNYIHERIPTDRCIMEVATELPEVAEADPVLSEVYAAVDGIRTVERIMSRTYMSRFAVFKALALLYDHGAVVEAPPDALIERAADRIALERFQDALSLLDRAVEEGAHTAEVFEMAGRCCEALGRLAQATAHYGRVAALREAAGHREAATDIHLRLRELMPTDIVPRERLLQFFLEQPAYLKDTPTYDPIRETVELGMILHAVGRTEESTDLLSRVHSRFHDHLRATQRLAQAALDLSEPRTAVEILSRTANDYLKREHYSPALRLLRRIRTIDPSHQDIEAKIRACSSSLDSQRPPSGRVLRVVIVLLVVGGAEFVWFRYNREALKQFRTLDAEELALQGEFTGARASLENFRHDYPGTVPAFVAVQLLDDLQARERDYLQRKEEREEKDRDILERRRRHARSVYESALEQLDEGKLEEALSQLKECASLMVDPEWRRENDVEKTIREIEEYLAAADSLASDFDEAMRQQRYEDAWEAGRKLLEHYPHAPTSVDVFLPVVVESRPSGARVIPESAGGRVSRLLKTPAALELEPTTPARLRLVMNGYHDEEISVVALKGPRRVVALDRRPDSQQMRSEPPVVAPILTDDQVFVGDGSGRLSALDLDSLEQRWQVTLPELQEVVAPPVTYEDQVLVAGSGPNLWVYDARTGEFVRRILLTGQPSRAAPAVYRGVVVVALEGSGNQSLVALTIADGWRVWSLPLDAAVTAGPIAVDGSFVVGLANGSLLRLEGLRGAVEDEWTLRGAVSALYPQLGSVIAGTEDGALHKLRWTVGRPDWSIRLPGVGEVEWIQPYGQRLLVAGSLQLHLLEPRDGSVKAQVPVAEGGPTLLLSGPTVLRADANGRLEQLGGPRLEAVDSWRTEEPLAFAVASGGSAVLVGRNGGFFRIRIR